MTTHVISCSPDGSRAQIVVHGTDAKGKRTSKTRHVRLRGNQWEYATTVKTRSHEGVLEREVVQEVYEAREVQS